MGTVMNGDGLDGMKSSPANGPGTPRDDGAPMGEYNLGGFGGPPDNVSILISILPISGRVGDTCPLLVHFFVAF